MRPKIICFNGPPNSGKDLSAAILKVELIHKGFKVYPKILKFAYPLKKFITDFYFDGDENLFNGLDSSEEKEKPSRLLYGASSRQVQIEFAENFLKKLHGNDIFACIARDTIIKNEQYEIFIISDLGFDIELDTLAEEFGLDNIYLIRVFRKNCDFNNDSRKYLNPRFEDNFYVLDNNYSIENLFDEIKSLIIDLDLED